jgi:hypothetical protein
LDLKMNYPKRQGQDSGATGPAQWKNRLGSWAGVETGDEMKKMKK